MYEIRIYLDGNEIQRLSGRDFLVMCDDGRIYPTSPQAAQWIVGYVNKEEHAEQDILRQKAEKPKNKKKLNEAKLRALKEKLSRLPKKDR